MKNKKILIIGAGISGITLAERFASDNNEVTIIEQRKHIGGNCYDLKNKSGIVIQKYGPHIFHTKYKEVWQYLSRFTNWIQYQHKVLGYIDNQYIPIPFNLNSLHILFPEKMAAQLEKKLIKIVGRNKKMMILDFLKSRDADLKKLAEFIYKKVFLEYTSKQWGLKPHQIDPSVTARVPIIISRDNRWFFDRYQGIPKNGYTEMFKKMIKKKSIKIKLNSNYHKTKVTKKSDIQIYTGAIDRYFNYKFGKLDYRHVKMKFQTLKKTSYQPAAVVNYPSSKFPFTRITEFKKLTSQKSSLTTIGKEYPGTKGFMAWPVNNDKNRKRYQRYKKEAMKLKRDGIYFLGRLAEFKYYNMDDAVKNSIDFYKMLSKT